MSFSINDFRSDVVWCTTNSECLGGRRAELFGETKVHQLEIACCRKNKVLRLEISEDNSLFMQMLQGQNDIGNVKLRLRFTNCPLLDNVTKELSYGIIRECHASVGPLIMTSWYKLHQKEQSALVLNYSIQPHNKRVLDLPQEVHFVPSLSNGL